MAATFFITLREGLEAALIVGIIAAYLTKAGRRDLLPAVVAGVALAVGLCIAVGVGVVATIGRLPLNVQATLEGMGALLAVVVVTWMLFWMRRQGRAMKGDIEGHLATALAAGTVSALVGMAFLAVIREGFETVLFLLAVVTSRGDTTAALIGGILGLVVAGVTGYAIFAMGKRINLKRFFTVTGTLLIFVAAGLVTYAVAEFTEAGILPPSPVAWDLSPLLSDTSPLGSVLFGLVGYRAAPTVLQVVAYLAYLIPVLTLFLFDDRLPLRRRQPVSA
ncbi:MAG: iron uptake transporter permease EfeU [Chloroflexota bacterium]